MSRRPRVSWRARYSSRRHPADWLIVTSALRRVAYEPFVPGVTRLRNPDATSFLAQVAVDLVVAEIQSWCLYVIRTLEHVAPHDGEAFGRVIDRAGHFFPELLALKPGEVPELPEPPATEPMAHERASRLKVLDAFDTGYQLYDSALADLAELVLVWLDAYARNMGNPGLPRIPRPPRRRVRNVPV